jgi:hypothetical protein
MYYIQIGTGSLQTLEELKITSARVDYVANGIDSFSFMVDSGLDVEGLAFGAVIKVYDMATCIFIGEVTDIPADESASSPAQKQYKARNFLSQLERMQFTQTMFAWNGSEQAQFEDPRVLLGTTYPGTRITNVAQLYYALELAYGRGVPIVLSGSDFTGGFICPIDQKENISCWDVVISQLRWMPDHVLYSDYSTGYTIPKLVVPDVNWDVYPESDLVNIQATPRHDLRMVGLNVYFKKVSTVDGSYVESRTVQSAGDNTSPFATNLYVDLDGGSTEIVRQAITVDGYPSFEAPYSIYMKQWIEDKAPWLSDITGYEITNVARTGTHAYEKELLTGTILKWMPVSYEEETITVTVEYDIKDDEGNYIERATIKIPVQVTSCNGSSKTYSKVSSSESGETEPAGLAAGIYASWSRLHWDGSLSSYLPKVSYLHLGLGLNIAGGNMSNIGAIIQSMSIDLQTLATDITFGTCRGLEADSYTALYRAIRYRRSSTRLLADEDDTEAIEKDDTSIQALPKGQVAQSPGVKRKQIGTSSTNNRKVSLSSEDLATDEEAKLRAVTVPGGSVKVMASGTMDVFKWDATAPTGYEWETVNIVLDNKIATREILVKTATKADVEEWDSDDARLLLQVKGGTGGDAGKLRIDKGYLKT